mmetsp:Transcript_38780/g.111359  ORF Transcript_38780/g.111359 Transcript_38780/m.111359 type:complete len:316 (-) Transcript_38780:250-1197(-)
MPLGGQLVYSADFFVNLYRDRIPSVLDQPLGLVLHLIAPRASARRKFQGLLLLLCLLAGDALLPLELPALLLLEPRQALALQLGAELQGALRAGLAGLLGIFVGLQPFLPVLLQRFIARNLDCLQLMDPLLVRVAVRLLLVDHLLLFAQPFLGLAALLLVVRFLFCLLLVFQSTEFFRLPLEFFPCCSALNPLSLLILRPLLGIHLPSSHALFAEALPLELPPLLLLRLLPCQEAVTPLHVSNLPHLLAQSAPEPLPLLVRRSQKAAMFHRDAVAAFRHGRAVAAGRCTHLRKLMVVVLFVGAARAGRAAAATAT